MTSEEIATLDLIGNDCAVLSGCHSGIGKNVRGEGVSSACAAFAAARDWR